MCLFFKESFVWINAQKFCLGHTVALWIDFQGISILFSIVAVPAYIPTNSAGGFFSTPSPAFVQLLILIISNEDFREKNTCYLIEKITIRIHITLTELGYNIK